MKMEKLINKIRLDYRMDDEAVFEIRTVKVGLNDAFLIPREVSRNIHIKHREQFVVRIKRKKERLKE